MTPVLGVDYSVLTEQPAQGATRRQMAMLETRYAWAAAHSAGKDVLEVACGAGLGLGWLASVARSVEAGDLDPENCRVARETYPADSRVRIQCMDASRLPFESGSFDRVLLLEAVYYLPDAERFVKEARRVLKPSGKLLIATVNCEYRGFHPSPFHTRYFCAKELGDVLSRNKLRGRMWAGFPERNGLLAFVGNAARRAAVAAGLAPRTMQGRAMVKRLLHGRLERIPRQIDPEKARPEWIIPVEAGLDLTSYRTLYAEGSEEFS